MKKQLISKLSVALSIAILVVGASACSHSSATAGQDYGQVRTEASSTESTTLATSDTRTGAPFL